MKAQRRREIVNWAQKGCLLSARGACSQLQWPRSSYYYQSRKNPWMALRMRLKELAASRPRFGCRRLHVLLRREGWQINHKVTYWLYYEENLQIRTRKRRKIATQPRLRLDTSTRVDDRWSMDFVTDQLADGRFFRVLAVVDQFSRECVALHAGLSIRSKHVAELLHEAIRQPGAPAAITCDNGSEFTSRYFDSWASSRKIDLDFIRPGRPVENVFIESFNGRVREECLSQN